jgi:hypothetical protein
VELIRPGSQSDDDATHARFDSFVADAGTRLRRALVAR